MNGSRENANADERAACGPEMPDALTLEAIVEFTGEFGHLNELVMLRLEKEGGFTDPSAYFSLVNPVLDLLELEIRVRCVAGMSREQMRLVVKNWIDGEIANLR